MRNLIIISLLLFAVGCTSAVVKVEEPIVKLPEVKVEKGLDLLEIDMNNRKSVLDIFRRSGIALPLPFTNKVIESRARELCQKKQKSWRANRFTSFPDVNMKLYGKHPTRKGVFMCLPDKVTKLQAKYYCKTVKRKLHKYDNKTNRKFTCIKEN